MTISTHWIDILCTQQRLLVCGHRTCANIDTFLRYLESTNGVSLTSILHHLFQEYNTEDYGIKSTEWVFQCVSELKLLPFSKFHGKPPENNTKFPPVEHTIPAIKHNNNKIINNPKQTPVKQSKKMKHLHNKSSMHLSHNAMRSIATNNKTFLQPSCSSNYHQHADNNYDNRNHHQHTNNNQHQQHELSNTKKRKRKSKAKRNGKRARAKGWK